MNAYPKFVCSALLALCCALPSFAEGDFLKGWIKGGSDPKSYEVSLDKAASRGPHNAVRYRSLENVKEDGFGTVMQIIQSEEYKGKRVRLSAYIKPEKVSGWAGLWLRVDGRRHSEPIAFDNMSDRPVKGSSDWLKCEVVLDVPEEGATAIAFGFMLSGNGAIYVSEMALDIVDNSVPVTRPSGNAYPRQPVNLDFK